MDGTKNIWVIYQGEQGKKLYDKLVKHFNKYENINFFKTGDQTPNTEKTVYGSVLNDINRADLAIALVTPDSRPFAGNLYFEIGLFIGHKGANKILICLQEGIPEIISDLGGHIYCEFDPTKDDIWKEIDPFIFEKPYKDDTIRSKNKKRERVCYLFNDDGWLKDAPYSCDKSKCICDLGRIQLH